MFNRKSPVQTKLIAHQNVWILIIVLWNRCLQGHHPPTEKKKWLWNVYLMGGGGGGGYFFM